jgi:hypothetical protein
VKIEDIGDEYARMDVVLGLYRANSQTLGFMPKGAFEERARAGTLLVAVDGDEIVGYLLYDIRLRRIVIAHLCIDSAHRGEGVAPMMVAELRARHSEQDGILVNCRNDYDAHRLWPRLDFESVNERPGRGREGMLLTKWWLDFGHPTLFTMFADQEHRLRIAVDTDVFIDLVEDRPESAASRALVSDWVVDVARVVVTKTVNQELGHHEDAAVRKRRRAQLTGFARADTASDDWKEAELQLHQLIGRPKLSAHGQLDLQHVARAAAAHVGLFASRDNDLIRRFRVSAWELFQLKIGTPADLLADLWRQTAGPYAPSSIENTTFKFFVPSPKEDDELYAVFSNRAAGERKKEFSQYLRQCRSDPLHWEMLVLRSDGKAVALVARSCGEGRANVSLFRVAGSYAGTIARQVAHVLRDYALRNGAETLVISDQNLSPQLPEGLISEGFVEAEKEWWSVAIDKHIPSISVAHAMSQLTPLPKQLGVDVAIPKLRLEQLTSSEILELERRFAPLKVADSRVPTYSVPIRPVWAEQLFDTDLSSGTLFNRNDDLGISREHVYYSGAARGEFGPPSRILWYVSHERKRPGTGAVRATSKVEEVAVGRPLDLYRRFSRLGVYQREQILKMGAKRGTLMAIRFSDTEVFKFPIPHSEFFEIVENCGYRVALRSPQKLPDRVFDIVYERGMHGRV